MLVPNLNDIQLNEKEVSSFKSAFDSPDFRKLLSQYVEEISDPKVRSEQDAYIRKLEEEGTTGATGNINALPAGKAILRPSKLHGFVVKLRYVKKSNDNNGAKLISSNSCSSSKLFINMVSSDYIDEPSAASSSDNTSAMNEQRHAWSVPYSLGPVRMETDKSGDLTPTFDACYHPKALEIAMQNYSFRDMLAKLAVDAVIAYFERMNDAVIEVCNNIDKSSYRILRGVNYINGDPPVMLVSSKKDEDRESNKSAQNTKNGCKQHMDTNSIDDERSFGKGLKQGFLDGFLTKNDEKKAQMKSTKLCTRNDPRNMMSYTNSQLPTGEDIPEYAISERSNFDIANHHNDPQTKNLPQSKSVVIKVHLPKAKRASELILNVQDNSLSLKSSPDSGTNYRLECKLPYTVKGSECGSGSGSARWDKASRNLTVELPCKLEQ